MKKQNTLAKIFAFFALFWIVVWVAWAGVSVWFSQQQYKGSNTESAQNYLNNLGQQPTENLQDVLNALPEKEDITKKWTWTWELWKESIWNIEKDNIVVPVAEETSTWNIQ